MTPLKPRIPVLEGEGILVGPAAPGHVGGFAGGGDILAEADPGVIG